METKYDLEVIDQKQSIEVIQMWAEMFVLDLSPQLLTYFIQSQGCKKKTRPVLFNLAINCTEQMCSLKMNFSQLKTSFIYIISCTNEQLFHPVELQKPADVLHCLIADLKVPVLTLKDN